MKNILGIIGATVGIMGGLTGFLSTLLPIWRSRLKIQVEIIPEIAQSFHYEEPVIDHDEDQRRDFWSLNFVPYLGVDICIINLSNQPRSIYSIKMVCDYGDQKDFQIDLVRVENEKFDFQKTRLTKEIKTILPIEIKANNAVLRSVYFKLPQMCDSSNTEMYKNNRIIIYCQGKQIASRIFNYISHSELNNL